MKNTNSEVAEVVEVKEVEDSESSDFNFLGARMLRGGQGFSFTLRTSFTSFTSLAFTGVYA
jgi:hypothetical protein